METVIEINLAPLYAKLAKVMSQIARLAKTGMNTHFNYKFATDADVSDTVRGLLAEQNVAFLVNMIDVKQEEDMTRATFAFTFACGDTGATITNMWQAEAQDKGDKGINKVATAAVKYFLLKTFLISTGDPKDDPDNQAGVSEKKKARETATAFVQAWRSKGVTDADMLAALKVEKLSAWDWSDGDKTANETVQAWIDAQKAAPPAQPKNGNGGENKPGKDGRLVRNENIQPPVANAETQVRMPSTREPEDAPKLAAKDYKLDKPVRRTDFLAWCYKDSGFGLKMEDVALAFDVDALDLHEELEKHRRCDAEEIVTVWHTNRNAQTEAAK